MSFRGELDEAKPFAHGTVRSWKRGNVLKQGGSWTRLAREKLVPLQPVAAVQPSTLGGNSYEGASFFTPETTQKLAAIASKIGEATSPGVSVGALKKAVENLSKRLQGLGFETSIGAFKSGKGGTENVGASYVELNVTSPTPDEYGDRPSTLVKFIANGYGDREVKRGAIGGMQSASEMTSKALDYILQDLKQQGWEGA